MSTNLLCREEIRGSLWAKERGPTKVGKARTILPSPCMLQLLDSLLSKVID